MFVFIFLSNCILQTFIIIVVSSSQIDNVTVKSLLVTKLKIVPDKTFKRDYTGYSLKNAVEIYPKAVVSIIDKKVVRNETTVTELDFPKYEVSNIKRYKRETTSPTGRFFAKESNIKDYKRETTSTTESFFDETVIYDADLNKRIDNTLPLPLLNDTLGQSIHVDNSGKITLTESRKSQQVATNDVLKNDKTDRRDNPNDDGGILQGVIKFWKDMVLKKRDIKPKKELPFSKIANSSENFRSLPNNTVSAKVRSVDGQDIVFRIVKGKVAKLGEVPYQIGFMRYEVHKNVGFWMVFCGGSLIKENVILSAGHCFHFDHWTDGWCSKRDLSAVRANRFFAVAEFLSLIAFKNYLGKDGIKGQWRRLRYVSVHPDHFHTIHDVSVAFTYKPFTLNDNVALIPMASLPKDYNITCKTSGYGLIQRAPDEEETDELRTADLRLLDKSQCQKIHGDVGHYICTSDEVSDIADGDSGGPLVCKDTGDPNDKGQGVLVGITCSYKPALASSSQFTRVTSYRKYIDEAISNHGVTYLTYSFDYVLCFIIPTLYNAR